MTTPKSIFIIAGEPSGDELGGALMAAIGRLSPDPVVFRGVGGARMAGAGLASRFPMTDIALFGITSIIRHIPRVLRRVKETVAAIVAEPPDVLVLIDCPGFNRRVGRAVRKLRPDIPIVFYVSPTVWAWRPGRAREMRPYVDRLLALFPFEPAIHERLGGPPTVFVGHPIAERLVQLRPNPDEERRRACEPRRLLVLLGSRRLEVTRLAPLFSDVLQRLSEQIGPFEPVMPIVPHLRSLIEAEIAGWPVRPRLIVDEAEKWAMFRTAHAALACSGTVTLEVAMAHVPQVVAYRANPIEAAIVERLITTDTAVLANHILGEKVVPEFIQRFATPEAITASLVALMTDSPAREAQLSAIQRIDAVMDVDGEAPSERAARVVLDAMGQR